MAPTPPQPAADRMSRQPHSPYRPFSQIARGLDAHTSTLARWRDRGVRDKDGDRVRLASIRIGGRWMNTDAEVERFLDRLNHADHAEPALRSPAERRRAADDADRQLAKLGL